MADIQKNQEVQPAVVPQRPRHWCALLLFSFGVALFWAAEVAYWYYVVEPGERTARGGEVAYRYIIAAPRGPRVYSFGELVLWCWMFAP